ncbi:uncharacterized protein LOC103704471 [Phoenix dactylifera]|uniref:Uncharacterized protein LOC103704471 n=1 Tax=Phoenix dactylifera TaxID=42345 RepID=A0A8B7BV24_PHODC|nr:uncharacterized protein LOC103704471 [Phoenix dactylifera]
MDLWVAAGASGAGYLVERWRKVVKKGEECSLESLHRGFTRTKPKMPSSMDKKNDRKSFESGGSIFCRLIRRKTAEDASSCNDKVPCNTPRRSLGSRVNAPFEGMASNGGVKGDTLMSSGEYIRDHNNLLSLQPWIFRKDSTQICEEGVKVNGEFSDKSGYEMNSFGNASLVDVSPISVSLGYGHGKGRRTLRSRRSRRHSVKPLTSTETCLVPQLYEENFEIEEYVFSSLSPPSAQAAKPFVITDGNRVISKSSHEPLGNNGLLKDVGVSSGVKETVVGVSPLPDLKKLKRKSREMQNGRLVSSTSQRSCKFPHSQESLDGTLVFCLGASIGVISTIMSHRKEVEKLNDQLKHTQNLVQDLQEELEMKESLTVKELANESCGSHGHDYSKAKTEDSIESFKEQVPTSYFPEKETVECNKLPLSNVESMSEIEAELEAELERLELNMNADSQDGRISAFGEFDEDLIADVVHGELREDMLEGGVHNRKGDNDTDSKRTSTTETHDANYAISPRELSLRLHEVIQLRLEGRIKELEGALEQSQKQVQLMEVDRVLSQKAFSSSDVGSYSTQESLTRMGTDNSPSQAVCLNLTGDALNAYDEAYEEFLQMPNTEEENVQLTANVSNKKFCMDGLHADWSPIWGMEGGSADKLPRCAQFFEKEPREEQFKQSKESNDAHESHGDNEDESDDDDDDVVVDDELIQQIVERTRQGSPVVLHAQRMLFSLDE